MTGHGKATGTAERVLSIDIFRGATIAAMVFANTTTKMGLPWWMEHASHTEGRTELITWVDLIFPAFLFIMGLAIPLAVDRRLGLSVSRRALLGHVALRGLLLMWLGGVMYGFGINAEAMGIPIATWVTLGFVALVLLLSDVPLHLSRAVARPALGWGLRAVSLGYFVWATKAYRGGDGSPFFHADGFTFSILGLLGFAYITSTVLYLATRESPLARLAIGALIVLLGVHMQQEDAFLPAWIPEPLAWFGVLSHLIRGGLIVLAGTFLGELFVARGSTSPSRPGRFMALFGIGFLTAAALVDGDFFATFVGLRKTLFCIGTSALVFLVLWEVERHKGATSLFRALSRPLLEVGRNPLFTYSLQFGLGGALALVVGDESRVSAIEGYTVFGTQGWYGAASTALPFTLAVVSITCLANRYKVRIKL